jgi:hypothetical protein
MVIDAREAKVFKRPRAKCREQIALRLGRVERAGRDGDEERSEL